MNQHPIGDLMVSTMEKIREMVDVNTIIGDPIITADNTTIIPISQISFGFGSGGSDYVSKNAKENTPVCFGGGGGAGVTISPVSFLIISKGETRILPINPPVNNTADRLVEMIPDMINKVTSMIDKAQKDKKTTAEETAE